MNYTTKVICVNVLISLSIAAGNTNTMKKRRYRRHRIYTPPSPRTLQQRQKIAHEKTKNHFAFCLAKIKKLSKRLSKKENARKILYQVEQLDPSKQVLFNELDIHNQESLVPLKYRDSIECLSFYGARQQTYGLSQFKKKIQEFIQEFTYTTQKDTNNYQRRVGQQMYLELWRLFYAVPDIDPQKINPKTIPSPDKVITPIICALIRNPKFIKKLKENYQ